MTRCLVNRVLSSKSWSPTLDCSCPWPRKLNLHHRHHHPWYGQSTVSALFLGLFHSLTPTIVEVRLTPDSTARFDTIRKAIHQYIWNSYETIALPSKLDGWKDVSVLASSVEQITACESSSPTSYLPVAQAALQIHVYQPNDGDGVNGFSTGPSNDGEEIMAASVCELPSRQWEGLWDSLIFPDDTKTKLLDYIYATVLFSDADVDCKL